MSWYYDDYSVSNYYKMRLAEKEKAAMRKRKKKLKEIEDKKKKKILLKLIKEELKLKKKEENKRKRKERVLQKKQELKESGWKSGYVRQNVLVRNNKAKDLNLCKEIYLKAKSGMTTRQLALEYDRPNNWVLRYKYEYEAYLKALEEKGEDNETQG